MADSDWVGWEIVAQEMLQRVQIIGDDLFFAAFA
jgi:enolase